MVFAEDSVTIASRAFEAFLAGDLASRKYVDREVEWTFLDPSVADPTPATCHGRAEVEKAVGMWASMGLTAEIEEITPIADKVLVVLHAPGLDRFRARTAQDRNFHLLTVRDGSVVAIGACRNRQEALMQADPSPDR